MELYGNCKRLFDSKDVLLSALRERERSENASLTKNGFLPYRVKGIGLVTGGDYTGWPYVTLIVNGHEVRHIETGLKYDLFGGNVENLRKIRHYDPEQRTRYANYEQDNFAYGGTYYRVDDSYVPRISKGVTVIERSAEPPSCAMI
jgi:hypothetical protein